MADILNSGMLDSDTAILDSDTLFSFLRSTQNPSHSTLTLTQTHSFSFNLMMAAILNSAILHKKNFTQSFWLNLMMAAILNSAMLDSNAAILDSDTLLSSLRFTQKHYPSTLTLTQTNSMWLTWRWQPSWIQPFFTKTLTQTSSIWLKLFHFDWTWWWQPSWNLPSWIQTPCYLLSDSLKNTLPPLWLWLQLIPSD